MFQSPDMEKELSLLNQIDAAVIVLGYDGVIKYVNQHVCVDMGRPMDAILGKHYRQLFWPEFLSVYDEIVAKCEKSRQFSSIYYWAEMAIWEQISAQIIVWDAHPAILLTITNISDVTRSDYRSDNHAYFDSLLKIPNGAKLEEDINVLASIETVALIYFEIKRFEDINELYGWENGDNLLMQVRDWLLTSEMNRAQLYRVNNGFAIFGRKLRGVEDAHIRVREIQERFKKPWALSAGGNNIYLYCSVNVGIVYGKYIKNEMRNMLMRTIRATAKTSDGFAVYDEEEDRKAKRTIQLRDSIINCVFDGMKGFEVHYQPIVEVASRHWIGVEALCRWTTPAGEPVSPVDFIRVAEQLNLIEHIDSWVRKTAMQQCTTLGLIDRKFILDVNFSPTQPLGEAFIADLLRSLREFRFPPHKLNIEITEGAKLALDVETIAHLTRLKDHGVGLSLDDFGIGYSSMESLMKMSFDTLKTDKVFLEGIGTDIYRQYVLRMLVELAHYRDMFLIAEGVETEEEFSLVSEYGVDRVQGYLFSKPMPYGQLQKEVDRFHYAS